MLLLQKFTLRQRLIAYAIAGILLIVAYSILVVNYQNRHQPDQVAADFQEHFIDQQRALAELSGSVSKILSEGNPADYWPRLERAINHHDIIAQIYLNNSLFFWNSQKINNDILYILNRPIDTVILQNTGWFLVKCSIVGDYQLYLLKEIKPEYSYVNSYLPQEMNEAFGAAHGVSFSRIGTEADYQISDMNDQPVLGMNITESGSFNHSVLLILFILFILLYLLIILLLFDLYDLFNSYFKFEWITFLFFTLDLFIIRLLDHYLQWPFLVKQSFIFNEGSQMLFAWQSVGDQLLNALIISAIGVKGYYFTKRQLTLKKQSGLHKVSPLGAIIYWLVPFLVLYLVHYSYASLGYSPLFGIKLNDINGYLLVINTLILLVGLYFYQISLVQLFLRKRSSQYLFILIALFLGISAYFISDNSILVITTSLFAVLMVLIGSLPEQKQDVRIAKYILTTVVISISAAAMINQAREIKRDDQQILAADFVSVSRDTHFEAHYQNVVDDIKADKNIHHLAVDTTGAEDLIFNYVMNNYFLDFKDRYLLQVIICKPLDSLFVQNEGTVAGCADYFEGWISELGTPVGNSELYLLSSSPSQINYLSRLTTKDTSFSDTPVVIYFEFLYFIIPEGLGYPELLVDDQNNVDLTGYSYAVYDQDRLVYKLGDFPYYTTYSDYADFPNKEFYSANGAKHLKYQTGEERFLIISRPETWISEQLVVFSALFICFVIITFLVFVVIYGSKGSQDLALNFRSRLQVVFISTTSLVVTLLALITLFYVETINDNNLMGQLSEKTSSVIIELNHKLSGNEQLMKEDPQMLSDLLEKFSLVFFSDINLYDPSGQMLATSRPEIFNRGLISENINPMAFEQLFVKHKLFYITNETIGTASYYSAYAPLTLGTDETVCILNLPYFARQSEVRSSYFRMVFTFINVFVIFGILGAFLSLFLARILAKPLFILQRNLGNIRIDKKNERITWKRNDEIGLLIGEYNKMVDKLEQSAELLKHSERESTWREVARQIAHEIKNPLTPMKLNVQFLEKAYTENDPAFKSKVSSVSASLISQIDALDQVAEMFSDFAKSNALKLERVDLIAVIKSSVALFKSHQWVQINVGFDQNEKYEVRAVEKDLLRVFNNLLKNAIQAMEEKRQGSIDIEIQKSSPFIGVTVSDTGKGIPSDQKASIFQPYFTTKSAGTGLGLAIVKNIMAEIGGEIGFESKQTGGTTFILKFREHNGDS